MTHTAKHTPGPLHNGQPSLGQPCTCCILLRTGEPLESIHGKRPCADISRIELCPKHAAGPALYEALRDLVSYLQDHVEDELLDNWAPVLKAAYALAQAEGQQL